jgi:uncharacterized sulfatase
MQHFLKALATAAGAIATLNLTTAAQQIATPRANQPNFIVILIDDMGYGDLSCYDEHAPQTPRIDQLAREGIRFTQYYSNSPICSPSRAAMLTGQYPQRWGIGSYLGGSKANENRGIANWLDLNAPVVSRTLQSAGYATGHFGKWHLGGGRDISEAPLITEYGFDKSLTQFEGLGDRLLVLMDKRDGSPPVKNDLAIASEKLGKGRTEWIDRSVVTARFADDAINFMDQARANGKPFYVNLWPDDVHSPFFPPEAQKDESKKPMYRAVVEAMDQQLTKLLDHVAQTPALRDNTVILLASDNGPEPGAGSAGPFRGTKTNLWEGGIREPFIVWAPGLMEPKAVGTTNDVSVIVAMDLAPSLLALAGAHPLHDQLYDGTSVSATLLGKEQAIRKTPIFWRRPPDRPGPIKNPFPDLAMRDANWKLLCMADGSSPQLYDLAADPGEKTNLADRQPERVNTMAKALLAWNASMRKDKPQVPREPTQGE